MTTQDLKNKQKQLAYIIVEFQLNDAKAMKPYSENVQATFSPYNGRIIIQNKKIEKLEGTIPDNLHVVVIEFDSLDQAQSWYHSPAYQKLIPIRKKAGEARIYCVEGLLVSNIQ